MADPTATSASDVPRRRGVPRVGFMLFSQGRGASNIGQRHAGCDGWWSAGVALPDFRHPLAWMAPWLTDADRTTVLNVAAAATTCVFISLAVLGIVSGVTLVGMVGVMFLLDWRFSLIGLSVAPVLFTMVYHFTRRIKSTARTVKKKQSELMRVGGLRNAVHFRIPGKLVRREHAPEAERRWSRGDSESRHGRGRSRNAMERRDLLGFTRSCRIVEIDRRARLPFCHLHRVVHEDHGPLHERRADESGLGQVRHRLLAGWSGRGAAVTDSSGQRSGSEQARSDEKPCSHRTLHGFRRNRPETCY
jgi:ABC transporter transmembrane region